MKWLSPFKTAYAQWTRYWRWLLLERPMRFTRFGTFYVLFTIAVGAAAINTGNNLLYLILGIQLSFIIVSGFLSDSVLWGLRSTWRPAEDLFAGKLSRWNVELRKGWFPAALIKITGEWSAGRPFVQWIPWVPGHETLMLAAEVCPPERGWLTLRHVRYGTAFPFGLFEKTHSQARDERWLVFPRVEPLAVRKWLAPELTGAHTAGAPRAGEGSVPWRIREYRSGDSLRRIDWKAAAKRQRLIVKETEEDSAVAPLLMVNQWPAECEPFIGFLASLVWSAAAEGLTLGLCTPGRYLAGDASPEQWRDIARYLALVDPKQETLQAHSIRAYVQLDALDLWEKYRHEQR